MDPAKRRQIEYLLQTDPDFRAKFEARRAERAAKAALFPGRTAPMMSGQEFGPVAPAGFTPPPRSAGLPIEQGPTFEQRASDRPWYLPYDPATLTEAMGDVFVKQDLTATKDYVKDLASQPWNFLETERAQGVPEGLRRGLESILTGDEAKNPDKKALSVPGQIAFGGGALAPFMAGYGATGLGSRAVAAGEKTINPLALSKVFGDRLMALAAENPTFANILRAGLAKAIEGTSRGYVTGAGLEAVGQAFGSEGRPVPTDPATGKPLSSVEQIHEAGKSTAKFMGGLQTVSGLSAAIPSTAGRLAADVVGGSVGVAASGGDPLSPDQWLFNVYQPLATAIARVPFARAKYAGQVRTRAQENANNPEAATETRRQAMEDVMADPEASAAVVEELKNQGVPEEQIKVILDQIKKPKASTALEDDPKFGKQPIVMRYPSGDEVVLSIKPEAEGKRVQIVRHNLRTGAHDVINRGLDPNDVPKYLKKKLGKGMSFVGFANDLTPEAATAALSETVTKFARQHSWAESYAKDLIDYYTGQRTDLPEAPAGDQAQALHRKIRKTINRMAKEYTPEDVKPDATIAEPTAITRTPESPETTTDKNDRPLSALEQNKRLIESLPTEQDAAEDASMIYTKEMMDEVRNEASDFVDIGNGLSIHRMSPDKETWTVIQEGLPITGKIKLPDGTEVEQGHEIDLEDAKRVFGDKIPNPEDVSETPVEDAPTYSKQDLLDSVREGAEEGGVEKARASLNDESIAKIVAGLNDGVDPSEHVTPEEVRAELEAYLAKQEPSPKGKPVAKSKDAINRTVESIDEAAETPKAPEPAKAPTPEQPTEKPAEPKSEDTSPKPTSERMKWLEDQEAAVLKRIQERRKNINSGIDPADMADFIELGAIKLAQGFVKADEWMKEMVRVLGDPVRPHLRTIWTEANLKYEKSYKDPTRARPGGEVGINGEHYEGGQFLPTSKHTVKGEHSGKSVEKSFEDRAGDQVVGVGKYSNVLAKDLFAKDPDYAIWAADNLSGKSKHIADYLRSRPEYAEAKAAEIQKVKDVLSDENKEAMKNLGLELSDRGGKIVIGGKTYESRNIFKAAGAKFNGTEWTATAEQTKAIIDRLRGLSDATGRRGGISEFGIHDPQLVELRRTIAERPDRSGLDRAPGEIVDKKTESLLRLGEKTGMPSAVITEQVEDVAKIKTRYEDGSKMFMLASDPGSGKTYVLGAAIRELRRSGAKNITYVTLRKELIDQIKGDLAEYDIGDVKFVTYPEMRMSDVSDSDVLIFDEAHSIKNVAAGENGAQQAKAAARWIRRAKFTIFSTATPFENPVQAEYLEPTGIFKPFGGFQNFALAHGAELFRVGDSQFLRWKRGPHSTANAKAARDFFVREGIFTSRQIRLPEGMLDARMSKIEASPELVAQYNSLTAAAERNESSLRGFGKAWVVNLQKRLLESAKVQRGIEEAKDALARGRNPIIFVETKADRDIDIPDLIRREEEYEAAVREAITMKDTPPKRSDHKLPPMGVVDVLRAFMNDTGQDKIVIPGAEKVIMDALGEENVALFTGTVTATKAQKNLDDWRSGKKRVIVATMAKGGTGLSLHDKIGDHPTTQIVINLPWTATGVKQVAQRNARYGIKSKAEINWIFADNIDFDRALAARVGGRMADMGASVYGDAIKEASKLEEWSFEDATFSEINDGVHEILGDADKAQEGKAPESSFDKQAREDEAKNKKVAKDLGVPFESINLGNRASVIWDGVREIVASGDKERAKKILTGEIYGDSGFRVPNTDNIIKGGSKTWELDKHIQHDDPSVIEENRKIFESHPEAKKLLDTLVNGGKFVRRNDTGYILDKGGKIVGAIDDVLGSISVFDDVPLDKVEASETLSEKNPTKVDKYAALGTKAPLVIGRAPRWTGDKYQISNGHHRLLAARKRGDKTIRGAWQLDYPTGWMMSIAKGGQEGGSVKNLDRFEVFVKSLKKSSSKPEPSTAKKPEQKAPESVSGDGKVVMRMMPREQLRIKPEEYQPRSEPFSEETVQKILTTGWSDESANIKAYKNPNTGATEVLGGFSTTEAAKRLGKTDVPVRMVDIPQWAEDIGMPRPETPEAIIKAAKLYAKMDNEFATPQNDSETLRSLKELRDDGVPEEAIRNQLGPTKYAALDALSHLKPDGKFMAMLGTKGAEIVGKERLVAAAKVVGRMRKEFPDIFKTVHEEEVFDYMTEGGKVKDISMKKLESVIRERMKDPDFKSDSFGDKALDLNSKSERLEWYGGKYNPGRKEIAEKHAELKQRQRDAITQEEKDAIQKDIDAIEDQVRRIVDNQGTLGFDNLDVSFGIPNPEKLAQLARDVKRGLTAQLRKLGVRRQLAQQTTGQRAKDAGWFSRWILDPNTMFAAYEGQKPKRYGEYARDAQIAMNLAARNILKSAGEWQEKIGHGLKDISKAVGRDGLKNVGDWLEGGVENAPENVRAGLGKIRDALDEIREALKTSLRQRIVYDFTQDLVGAYRRTHGIDQGEPIPQDEFDAITERAVKFAELRIPDDWGIDDYFPHMFFGDYRVFYDGQIIGTGRNRSEAITAAHKHFVASGEKGDLDKYEIRMINFQTPDVTKLGDKELARFISNMQEIMPLGKAELKSALSGVVVPKSRRNKYAKFMFKREADAKGYEIDPVTVFEFYTGSAARYIELSRLSRIVQPAIEGLRSRGQESAAEIMERNFAYMWGQKPSNASRDFDNILNKAGFDIAPQALDRYLAYWRWMKNITFLQFNPGFHLINSLQQFQTLYPLEREGVKFSEAPKFLDSKEGRDAVERHGVRFFFGGKMSLDPSIIHKHLTPEQRQSLVYQLKGLRPESNNQLKAWAYMYLVGLKQGKTDAEAADYAFLEGNVGSQLLAITANQPGMVQGSVLSTVNQWKPFMVKNLSLVKRLIEAGNFSGATRWALTILALGGLRAAMRPAMLGAAGAGAYLSAQMYDKLKEEYGENFAKFVNFGLPALIGIDLSNTMTPLQIPTSVQELGGVEATIITNLLNAYRTESIHEPNKWKRVLNELPDNFPVGREINNFISVLEGPENGKYILSDPNGRMRFERDQVSAWKALLNRPLVDESVAYTIARAQKYITEKMDKVSDKVAASGINALREDKPFKAFEFSKGKYIFYSGTELFDWYKDHPQMPIHPVQIYRRQLQMVKEDRMTEIERAMSRGGTKAVKAYFKNLQKKSESQSSGK